MIMTIGCGKKDYEEYKIFSYANNKYGYVDKMDKVDKVDKVDVVGSIPIARSRSYVLVSMIPTFP